MEKRESKSGRKPLSHPGKRQAFGDRIKAAALALCITLGLFAWLPFMVADIPPKKVLSAKYAVRFYEILPENHSKEEKKTDSTEEVPEQQEEKNEPVTMEALPVLSDTTIKKAVSAKSPISSLPGTSIPESGEQGRKKTLLPDPDSNFMPRAISRENPRYPPSARRKGIEGRVLVGFYVDSRGKTRDISILEADPPGIFDESVLKAVASWRFEAGKEGRLEVPVHFSLKGP